MKNNVIIIGTRGSKLALYQAKRLKKELSLKWPNTQFEIKIIKTKGDKILDVALSKIGDKGLFTKEIEQELIARKIDIAVHSLKDLPTVLPEGLKLCAVLKRGEFRDALISKDGRKLHELSPKDKIATSSLRRKSQLLKINPDFQIIDIRGNVPTRIQKMKNGYCDAVVMAAAGLQRLEMDKYITEILNEKEFIPAVSQGIIALETRKDDANIGNVIAKVNHSQTMDAALAERAFLNALEGGCQVPVGCYTSFHANEFKMHGFISLPDASNMIEGSISGKPEDAKQLAKQLADSFYEKGAAKVIELIRKINE